MSRDKLELLYVKGFDIYSYENIHVDFDKFIDKATLLRGKVLEKNSNNGAGKSSLLYIIFYALFGKDIKSKALGDITRWKVKSGHAVEISLKRNGIIYTIKRYYKFKRTDCDMTVKKKLQDGKFSDVPLKGTGVELLVDGVPFSREGESSEIKKEIESVLGFSSAVFINSVLTSQKDNRNKNSTADFLTQTDKEQKAILTDILDLIDIDHAYELTKTESKDVTKNVELLEMKLTNLESQLKDKTHSYQDLLSKSKGAEGLFKKRKESIENNIASLKKEIPLLKKQVVDVPSVNSESIIEEEAKLNAVIGKIQKDLLVEKNITSSLNSLKVEINSLNSEIKMNKNAISDLSSELEVSKKEIKGQKEIVLDKTEYELVSSQLVKLKLSEKNLSINQADLNSVINKKEIMLSNCEKLQLLIDKIENELEIVKKEAKCHECHRNFKDGESDFFDKMIKEKEVVVNAEKSKLSLSRETIETISKDIKRLEEKSLSLSKELEDLPSIENKKRSIEDNVGKASSHNKWLNSLTNKISTSEQRLVKLSDKNKENSDIIKSKEKKIPQLNELLNELEIKKEKLGSFQALLLKVKEKSDSIKNLSDKKKNIESQLRFKEESLSKLNTELVELISNPDPYEDVLIREERFVSKLKESIKTTKIDLDIKTKRKNILNFWQIGFSQVGIKSYIIDEIFDILNEKSQEYLSIISEGTLSIIFEPEKNDKNKINIVFYNHDNKTSFDSLSGGEQKNAILAVDLALSGIAKERSKMSLDMKFLDEPFDGMDDAAKEISYSLLNKMSKGTNGYFIISHDERMQSFFKETIHVVKEDGISRIVDQDEFDRN